MTKNLKKIIDFELFLDSFLQKYDKSERFFYVKFRFFQLFQLISSVSQRNPKISRLHVSSNV